MLDLTLCFFLLGDANKCELTICLDLLPPEWEFGVPFIVYQKGDMVKDPMKSISFVPKNVPGWGGVEWGCCKIQRVGWGGP